MNIYTIGGMVLMLLSIIVARKIRATAYARLPAIEQEMVYSALKIKTISIIIFFTLILIAVLLTIYQFDFLPKPFMNFLILMFGFSIASSIKTHFQLKNYDVNELYIKSNLLSSIIILLGLLLFSVLFYISGY